MPVTVVGSLSSPIDCVFDSGAIVPLGDFSYTLTLTITGADVINSVIYSSGPPFLTVTGGPLIWSVVLQPGYDIFPDEYFRFVQYDQQFTPTIIQVDRPDQAPENSSVFLYNIPNPNRVTETLSFTVNSTTAAVPSTELVAVPQVYAWSFTSGITRLQQAIDNSRY